MVSQTSLLFHFAFWLEMEGCLVTWLMKHVYSLPKASIFRSVCSVWDKIKAEKYEGNYSMQGEGDFYWSVFESFSLMVRLHSS